MMKKLWCRTIVLMSFLVVGTLSAQLQVGETSPDWTAPICINGEGDWNLYEQANGAVNGGNYKVTWLNLYTSW